MSTFWDNSVQASDGSIGPAAAPIIGPGVEGKDYASNEWDLLELGGQRVPGISSVMIPDYARRLQNKKANGSDGSSPTFRGLNPAKIEIEVTLWTPSQLKIWEALLPKIFPRGGKSGSRATQADKETERVASGLDGIDISHPATALLGIRAVVIEGISGLLPGPVRGSKVTRLRCMEFLRLPPGKAIKTVVSAVPVKKPFQQNAAMPKNAPAPPSTTDTKPFPTAAPQQGAG